MIVNGLPQSNINFQWSTSNPSLCPFNFHVLPPTTTTTNPTPPTLPYPSFYCFTTYPLPSLTPPSESQTFLGPIPLVSGVPNVVNPNTSSVSVQVSTMIVERGTSLLFFIKHYRNLASFEHHCGVDKFSSSGFERQLAPASCKSCFHGVDSMDVRCTLLVLCVCWGV